MKYQQMRSVLDGTPDRAPRTAWHSAASGPGGRLIRMRADVSSVTKSLFRPGFPCQASQEMGLPAFAIGGIGPANVEQVCRRFPTRPSVTVSQAADRAGGAVTEVLTADAEPPAS
jgi:hypothetical protein